MWRFRRKSLELDRRALWAASMHKVVNMERKKKRKRHFDRKINLTLRATLCRIVVIRLCCRQRRAFGDESL